MIFEITIANLFATPYFWIFIGLLFLLFEVGTPGLFYFLSFSVAAFCTAGATLFIQTILYQALFFLLMVVIWLVILRLWVARAIQSTSAYVSNVDSLIGKHARVVVSIEGNNSGQVKVDGEVWSARSQDHTSIEKDSVVVIRRVSGVHLIVKKI